MVVSKRIGGIVNEKQCPSCGENYEGQDSVCDECLLDLKELLDESM